MMGRAAMAARIMVAMMAGHEKYPATMMATERMPERVVKTTEKMAKKKWSMRGVLVS